MPIRVYRSDIDQEPIVLHRGENCGWYIRGLESPRSRSVSPWIAGRGKVSGLGRRVFYCGYDSAAASKPLVTQHGHSCKRTAYGVREIGRQTNGERKRKREGERGGGGERKEIGGTIGETGEEKSRTTNVGVYGRTLIQSLIEISISRVNAPRSDTFVPRA